MLWVVNHHEIHLEQENELRKKSWSKEAAGYDKRIGFFERRVFGEEHRQWACARAKGHTLEVAVGTGLNLPHYPPDVRISAIDLSPEMLEIGRRRAQELGREVELREGDAHALPYEDETFDSVVCTYSLCNIPDPERAVQEMKRVLQPGGMLLLVDHIESSNRPLRRIQKLIEKISARFEGERLTRRPVRHVEAAGFEIRERERFQAGVVERVVAVKPSTT